MSEGEPEEILDWPPKLLIAPQRDMWRRTRKETDGVAMAHMTVTIDARERELGKEEAACGMHGNRFGKA